MLQFERAKTRREHRNVRTHVLIFFPWNPAASKFSGEKIWVDAGALGG